MMQECLKNYYTKQKKLAVHKISKIQISVMVCSQKGIGNVVAMAIFAL